MGKEGLFTGCMLQTGRMGSQATESIFDGASAATGRAQKRRPLALTSDSQQNGGDAVVTITPLSALEKAETQCDRILKMSADANRLATSISGHDLGDTLPKGLRAHAESCNNLFMRFRDLTTKCVNGEEQYTSLHEDAEALKAWFTPRKLTAENAEQPMQQGKRLALEAKKIRRSQEAAVSVTCILGYFRQNT